MKRASLLFAPVFLSGCLFLSGYFRPLVCGDGLLTQENGEECDDGNDLNSDGCSAGCTIEECLVDGAEGTPCEDEDPNTELTVCHGGLCEVSICDPTQFNDQCVGNNICILTQCVPAFGRSYTFFGFVVNLGDTDEAGNDWDPNGNRPDPQIELLIDGVQILATTEQPDSLTASFTETVNTVLPTEDSFEIIAEDADTPNQPKVAVRCVGLSAELLRLRGARCVSFDNGRTATIDYSIDPDIF